MAFRLVSSGGNVVEPAFVNVPASGVITPGAPVEWTIVSGGFVGPAGLDTTTSTLFGVALDYAQGASDVFVRVIPFNSDQLWEVDCANAASTAQVGIRQYLSASRGFVHNQVSNTNSINRVFLPLAMTGATTGSGKLIGKFVTSFTGI